MKYPAAIQNLIEKLSELPSVGPKTAERYVFYLLKQNEGKLTNLAAAIGELKAGVKTCSNCLMISASDPCPICADNNRRADLLCIVENTQDLLAIEATRQFTGRYFVLGGLISTIKETGPETLPLDKLIKRIKTDGITEMILALNFTLEGETTAMYLTRTLKNVKISRLAKGLPAGSDLEYADEITLANSLKYRVQI